MKYFKVVVFTPVNILEELMDSINNVIQPIHTNYDYAFSYSEVKSTWRPLKGAKPFKGEINKIERVQEIKLEFVIRQEDIKNVLRKILEIHPYEVPAIDIYPIQLYTDFI
ncbi:MAG: divalent cation tolerance protein CutA [Candidatus Heimdallarchaeaceae archaeon]